MSSGAVSATGDIQQLKVLSASRSGIAHGSVYKNSSFIKGRCIRAYCPDIYTVVAAL